MQAKASSATYSQQEPQRIQLEELMKDMREIDQGKKLNQLRLTQSDS